MEIICHRGLWHQPEEQNNISAFIRAHESGFGVELDVRDRDSQIVIAHNSPNNESVLFSVYLDELNHKKHTNHTIAINIKADGLSGEIKSLIVKYNLSNYFTFDMSIPEMLRYKNARLNYFPRLSEYETKFIMMDNASGIWLDAFKSEWYNKEYIDKLMRTDKHICVVSPELHGRDHTHQWALIKGFNDQNNLMLCTDKPNEAKEYFR